MRPWSIGVQELKNEVFRPGQLNVFGRLLLFFLVLIPCFILLLFAVSTVPPQEERLRIEKAYSEGAFQKEYPKYFHFRKVDMYTECVGIGISLYLEPSLESVLSMGMPMWSNCEGLRTILAEKRTEKEMYYSRYWHGGQLFLKPFYTYFSIEQVRCIVALVTSSLLMALFFSARARIGFAYASILLGTFFMVGTLSLFILVTHAVQFWLSALAAICILRIKQDARLMYSFGLFGALDGFFTFLQMGSLSLALPLLCYALAKWHDKESSKRVFFDMLWACVAWSCGLCLIWASKFLLATLLLPAHDLFGRTLDVYPFHGFRGVLESIGRNVSSTWWRVWGPLAVFAGWRFYKHRLRVPKGLWIVVLPAVLPLIWIGFMPGHSHVHAWFVSLILWPTLAAFFCLLCAVPLGSGNTLTGLKSGVHEFWQTIKLYILNARKRR